MDQCLESSFVAPSPPNEQFPTNLSNHEVQLDDLIEGIVNISLEYNGAPSQFVEQPRTSHKIPKLATKTVESVHIGEVGNTGMRNSTRQNDGGYANDSTSRDVENPHLDNYMEASFDYELNLCANCEPTSFEEATSHEE